VIAHLRKFKKRLQERFHLEEMILFGSRARGDWLYSSDIDLILVSEDFRPIGFLDRICEIAEEWDCDLLPENMLHSRGVQAQKKGDRNYERCRKYGIDI